MNINQILKNFLYSPPLDSGESASVLRERLLNDAPAMIGRFGSTEIKAVLLPSVPILLRPLLESRVCSTMHQLSGFFPSTRHMIERFSDLMLEDMKQLDILGSWRIEERLLLKNFPNAKRVMLSSLEPYLSDRPWSQVLSGRKVLIVHPFNTTIERQYNEKRTLLFQDQRVLPEFKSLKTVKAVQTVAGEKSDFADWFAALDSMKAAIDSEDFDIAIIGCGAYGFPLAAHVKRMGKKAVHMGGATQLLFGIKGKRWDDHPQIGSLYNEHWVRPSPEDVPQQANKVEGGCYW